MVKTVVNIILAILPVVCVVLIALSLGAVIISMNPDVKWNEYNEEMFPNSGVYGYYFNTLWSSLDGFSYATSHGKYLQLLNLQKVGQETIHFETWKIPIRNGLYKAIGLISGALFFLILAMAVHSVSKQKLFAVILMIFGCGTGMAGAYFIIKATGDYKDGIITALLPSAILPPDQNGYYIPDKDQMKMGYILAKYSAIITFVGCGLILGNVGLYIPFGDGKWIWKMTTAVTPKNEKNAQLAEESKNNNTLITEEKKVKKDKIITVEELNV